MAKVIEFYKRGDWKPKREWVPVCQTAKVIMFSDAKSKKSAWPGREAARQFWNGTFGLGKPICWSDAMG